MSEDTAVGPIVIVGTAFKMTLAALVESPPLLLHVNVNVPPADKGPTETCPEDEVAFHAAGPVVSQEAPAL